jgi:hypothetical protein
MKVQKWIFVTGTPRSGTTFVGKILSLPLDVGYLHEPFNPHCGVHGIDRLYLYVNGSTLSSSPYRQLIDRIFRHDFAFKTGYFKEDQYWRTIAKMIIGSRSAWSIRFIKLNPFYKTMVIKDPIGCLLTEYLAKHYEVKPVIIIRHPIAVVASAMRLRWNMNLDPLHQQRELIADYFSDDYQFLHAPSKDPVEQAAALWRALNKVLFNQASRHPSWQVILHENLSKNPVEHFRTLYKAFDLPWTPRIENKVFTLTDTENPVAARQGRVHTFRRNSPELFRHSLKMLSREQRQKVYEITKDVALLAYSKESFQLDNE